MMTYFNKQRLLIGALIVLVLINVSALATILLQRDHIDQVIDRERNDRQNDGHPDPERLVRFLDLTAEQRDTFGRLLDSHRVRMEGLRDSSELLRAELLALLSGGEVDKAAAKGYVEQIAALRVRAYSSRLDFLFDLRKHLTERQRQKLRLVFGRILRDKRRPAGGFRRGMQLRFEEEGM